jgi:hypothetical protein
LASLHRSRTASAFSGALRQTSLEVAIVDPTPARSAMSPQGLPAQKPAILPALKASTVRAGGDGDFVVALSERPGRGEPVAQQKIVGRIVVHHRKRRSAAGRLEPLSERRPESDAALQP